MKKIDCDVKKIYGIGVDMDRFWFVSWVESECLREKYGFIVGEFIFVYLVELNSNKN